MRSEVSYTYHPVGQGLFFSGKLELSENKEFNFVYDCGSESLSRVMKVVDNYTPSLPNMGKNGNKKLDLLIISHFHYDHISGLDHLLNQVKVDTVIMPYLSPIELLLYAVVNSGRANANSNYLEFLLNPYEYLLEKRVERIIVIGRGSENDEYIGDDFKPPDGPVDFNPESPFNITELGSKKGDAAVEKRLRGDGLVNMNYIGKKVIPKSHHGYALSFGGWLFRFFNTKNSIDKFDEKIQTFEDCLKNTFGKSSVEEILRDKKLLKIELGERVNNKFKYCYKTAFGKDKLNLTSLVLYNQILNKERYLKLRAFPCIYPFIYLYEKKTMVQRASLQVLYPSYSSFWTISYWR